MSLIEHRPLLEKYLTYAPEPLSAGTLAALLIWEDFFDYRLEMIDESLCVFADGELGTFMALPPLGPAVCPATVAACFRRMEEANGPVGVTRIECITASQRGLFPPEMYTLTARSPEYGYERAALAELRGNIYKSQRWACNHFTRRNHHRYAVWDPSMTAACLDLYDRWARERRRKYADPVYVQMLDDSRQAFGRALAHAEVLGLTGRVVFVDDRLAACTFGFPVSGEVFCIAFEIAENQIQGLPAFVFRALCADPALARYPLINTMDDFALDQVARVKQRYHPAVLWGSWTAAPRRG